jgi:NTE family protein
MRASMSVPGVFAPYRLGGRSLVDGGMADNVPIDVARDLGADIVIVVATQTPLAKGEDVRSLPQVLGQTVTLLILANERQQLATIRPTDVLISVDTHGLGSADFKKGAALIAAGREATVVRETELRRVAAARGAPRIAAAPPPAPPVIDYVRIENTSRISDEILRRDVEGFVGKPMNTDEIVAALQRIYALGVFTRVDFRIERSAGRTGLVVAAVQRPGDVNRLRPGVTIAAMGKGRSELDLSLEYRLLQLDAYGSDARFVGVVGDRKEFSAEYFKVLDSRQRWFVVPGLDLQRRPVAVYDAAGFRLGEYDVRYGLVSLAAGRQFGGLGEVRLGLERGVGKASVQEGEVTPREVDLDVGRLFVQAGLDTLDNPYFPTRGGRGFLQWTEGWKALGDVADYQKIEGRALYTFGWGRHALVLDIEGGDTLQGSLPLSSLFTLGGPFSFPGFAPQELTGETYAVARALYRFKLAGRSESLFGIPLYAGATLVAGDAWARRDDVDFASLRVGGSLYIAADTLIGPVFVAVGAADRGRSAVYLFIGRPF